MTNDLSETKVIIIIYLYIKLIIQTACDMVIW